MAEKESVLSKTVEFELPISKKKVKMRFATRRDMMAAKGMSKGEDAEDKIELNYLGQLITDLNGVPGPVDFVTLSAFPEKDLLTLRAYDNRLNNLSAEDLDNIAANFAKALKS